MGLPACLTAGPPAAEGTGDAGPQTLESHQESADDALRRPDDEQLVVHRRHFVGIAEQVAHADEHFPLRAAEVERQSLVHLHVEAAIETGIG